MKNLIATAAVLLVAGFAVIPAAVAAEPERAMRIEIPFAFVAGDQMHAPGVYIVKTDANFGYVELRSLKSALADRVALNRKRVQRNGGDRNLGFMRFEQLGSTYALRSVGAPLAEEGMVVKSSKAEKELAAKLGGGATGAEVTITQ